MDNKDKKFYLTIKGQKVEVSEKIYREYVRPVWSEQRRERRSWRCRVKGEKGKLIRCIKDCNQCPYFLVGNNAQGNNLSLEWLNEEGLDFEDNSFDIEQNYIDSEEKQQLYNAIAQLTPRQQEIVRMIYFEDKSQEEIRKSLGISKSSMSEAVQRIYATLRKILEKN